MAEDLEDGEFWLPSKFLTDDDVVMDFDMSIIPHIGSSASFSDFGFTESDDDDVVDGGARHQSSCPVHTMVNEVLSSSPQSTLYRCVCNQSSSRESVSPPQPQLQGEETTATTTATATFDLLNKAADEVARLKITMENENNNPNNNNKKVIGTGFFDCTKQRVSYPPLLKFPPQFLHFPPSMVSPPTKVQQQKQQPPPPSQNRATKNDNKPNNNRPLGLPPSAWPPLQAQPPAKSKAQTKSTGASSVGPPKGTGVFLPRCVPTTPANQPKPQPRKKDGNATKLKTGKGSQSQSNHRRNSSKASATATTTTTAMTTNHNDIQLPQEWIY